MPVQSQIVRPETFAPLACVMTYSTEAIELNNSVPQALYSAIFTHEFKEADTFFSPIESDCGIVNVNIGTSAAEIGGEKEPAAAASPAPRPGRATCAARRTRSVSDELPLAPGVEF